MDFLKSTHQSLLLTCREKRDFSEGGGDDDDADDDNGSASLS